MLMFNGKLARKIQDISFPLDVTLAKIEEAVKLGSDKVALLEGSQGINVGIYDEKACCKMKFRWCINCKVSSKHVHF